MSYSHLPKKQGLYDPKFEHDSCGVGFVCDIKGEKSNQIVRNGLKALNRLLHRGAVGADPKTGDGAGILIQTPHEFFQKVCKKENFKLPNLGEYGTGLIFLPAKKEEYKFCKDVFSEIIQQENQILLDWRKVPVDNTDIGETARKTEPIIEQPFIAKNKNVKTQLDFERKLYIIRKQIENIIRKSDLKQKSYFYITNLSSRTFSYKGLLMSPQLKKFFPDLQDKSIKSALCLIHARYSTNTFPTWDLAQPFRFLAHNGEINTLRGNINWMKAREKLLASSIFGKDIEKIKPVITNEQASDSAIIDNVFELLVLSGRTLPHAICMLIPESWENKKFMDKRLKNFYQYHACFMEPWDGPASIAFTDGKMIGAVLDRNGLRPSRYIITHDEVVVMASEVGVLDISPDNIKISGRLEPGKIFFIDTEESRIVDDTEIKKKMSEQKPYNRWIKNNLIYLDNISTQKEKIEKNKSLQQTFLLLKAFGYTREDLNILIRPMVENQKEPIGSMGNDTPHSVLSEKPQLLYHYFKQLFAQVTNPAIDPIREKLVMSLESCVGKEENILQETPHHCHKLKVQQPILTNGELQKIKKLNKHGFKTKTISLLFKIKRRENFSNTLQKICKESEKAIREGYIFIILSDRGINPNYSAVPALLAIGAVHHHLVRKALRTQIGIILETAEPRETHHFALLFGYGADLVNPYLAYESIQYMIKKGIIDIDKKTALHNYIQAIHKGLMKILSKMGISTLQSYRGAQIFEILGLNEKVVKKYFTGTASRIGGIDLETIAEETFSRHQEAFSERNTITTSLLNSGGVYQWKRDGEFHLWNPNSIAYLQDAVRKNNYSKYKKFAELINNQSGNITTLRGLLKFKGKNSISLEEVEPVEEIVKRFAIGAMSFGSISKETHETIAIAMNRMNAMSNTGEGGEDPLRFSPLTNGDSLKSAVKQVASGRFGVTTNYLVNADELQIKIAQGAKPGEGGHLPGHKVSAIIARTRYTTPGVTLISPPPHHDIYSIEDLKQLIFDLKNANPRARISVKLVSEIGVGTIAAGVAKGHADMILISGGDGGTGASPKSSIRHAGLPWELGISETHQTLVLNDLRSRVRLQTDGQMRTGKDVAIAAILGAEEFGFCTAALIVLGCVMLRHCHLNNCALGVATQDEILRKRFSGRPEYLINYCHFVAQEIREILANLGIRKLGNLIGRTELLEPDKKIQNKKAKNIDFSNILYKPAVSKEETAYCSIKQNHEIDKILDKKLIRLSQQALHKRTPVTINLRINNTQRTTGAMLSGEVCRLHGEDGLPEDTIGVKFKGVAGQSFAAFLAKGVTFELEGMANDYVGKGMFGGKLIVYPDERSSYKPEENIIIGNTTFYGAITGEAYIRGIAGERFCVRNSGLYAVVEGVGDHGCEYMTGGRVVVIGKTGRNFAAGMSGGIAYVYMEEKKMKSKCNLEMVQLEKPDDEDKNTIYELLYNHYKYTNSLKAKDILDNLTDKIDMFIKIMPLEYKRILESKKIERKEGLEEFQEG